MTANNAPHVNGGAAVPMDALQSEVMSAVRGAISTVMAGHGAGLDLAGIDLDFSPGAGPAASPKLLAAPDQALAAPSARPSAKNSVSRIAIAAAVTLAVGGAAAGGFMHGLPGTMQHTASPVEASIDLLPATAAPLKEAAVEPAVISTAPQPEPTPVVATVRAPAPAAPDVAGHARSLLESGQVREARSLLLASAEAETSDVAAWILARSFDGNYLKDLGKPDASADSAEARRWYERWFERAKKKGTVDKTVRLDRLLQSLP
jgi:hypothetical protein